MSLFNLVFGNGGWPKGLLDIMWGIRREMVSRYRDHWLERTRVGTNLPSSSLSTPASVAATGRSMPRASVDAGAHHLRLRRG